MSSLPDDDGLKAVVRICTGTCPDIMAQPLLSESRPPKTVQIRDGGEMRPRGLADADPAATDASMARFFDNPAVRQLLRAVESVDSDHDVLRPAHVELARRIADASGASKRQIRIGTDWQWPRMNVLLPLCIGILNLTKLVIEQYLWVWEHPDKALFRPELGLETSFVGVAECLPATLRSLEIRLLLRPDLVVEAIGSSSKLVNLRELKLGFLLNLDWVDQFMLRGGRPIFSETVPASAAFREQFLSIVMAAELGRQAATPLLDLLRSLEWLTDVTLVIEVAHIHCCDRVFETTDGDDRAMDEIMIRDVEVLGLSRDLPGGDLLLKYKLGDVDEDPADNAELWLDELNAALPPYKLGAAPRSLERLTFGEYDDRVTWCVSDPLPLVVAV